MVERRVTDGVRIAQLLSSELDGREDGGLGRLAVTNADRSVEADGERAYDVEADGERFASAFVHEDHVRLELEAGGEAVAENVRGDDLRTSVDGDRRLVLVESGAAVKRAADALGAAAKDLMK